MRKAITPIIILPFWQLYDTDFFFILFKWFIQVFIYCFPFLRPAHTTHPNSFLQTATMATLAFYKT